MPLVWRGNPLQVLPHGGGELAVLVDEVRLVGEPVEEVEAGVSRGLLVVLELEIQLVRVGDHRLVLVVDHLAAGLGNQPVGEPVHGPHAAAQTVVRLVDHRDHPRGLQPVRGGEPRHAAADDRDPTRRAARHRQARPDSQRGTRGEERRTRAHTPEDLPPGQASDSVWHGKEPVTEQNGVETLVWVGVPRPRKSHRSTPSWVDGA